jgi:two-component system response regulator FixJ
MPDDVSSLPDIDAEPHRDLVFVVDDDPLVRRGLEISLSLAGYQVVQFASARQFLEYLTPARWGCALIDLRMPEMDGLELQEELARRGALVAVVVMTGHADVPLAVRAMKAGAIDLLEKPFGNEWLMARINAALAVAKERAEEAFSEAARSKSLLELSSRERDVMNLMMEGLSTKEIALALNISPRTVDIHRSRVMEKMQVKSVSALMRKIFSSV